MLLKNKHYRFTNVKYQGFPYSLTIYRQTHDTHHPGSAMKSTWAPFFCRPPIEANRRAHKSPRGHWDSRAHQAPNGPAFSGRGGDKTRRPMRPSWRSRACRDMSLNHNMAAKWGRNYISKHYSLFWARRQKCTARVSAIPVLAKSQSCVDRALQDVDWGLCRYRI